VPSRAAPQRVLYVCYNSKTPAKSGLATIGPIGCALILFRSGAAPRLPARTARNQIAMSALRQPEDGCAVRAAASSTAASITCDIRVTTACITQVERSQAFSAARISAARAVGAMNETDSNVAGNPQQQALEPIEFAAFLESVPPSAVRTGNGVWSQLNLDVGDPPVLSYRPQAIMFCAPSRA
jgi:hypothetical protein